VAVGPADAGRSDSHEQLVAGRHRLGDILYPNIAGATVDS
jgi:hypothetical protein